MKFVFFIEEELTERDFHRFGLRKMIEADIEVRICQLVGKRNESLVRQEPRLLWSVGRGEVAKIFRAGLDRDTYVFPFATLRFLTLRYFKDLWKSSALPIELRLGGLPLPPKSQRRRFKKLALLLEDPWYFLKMYEVSLVAKIAPFLGKGKNSSILFCAGEVAYQQAQAQGQEVFSVRSLDSNLYAARPLLGLEKHIVFLDEYEPFHPDYGKLGVKTVSPDSYFALLNSFFSLLEKKFDLPVVIAAHPAAQMPEYKQYFEGRSVVQGETVELVRDAKYVLGHTSTAFQFAFLYQKPFLNFVTAAMIKVPNKLEWIKGYQAYGFQFHVLEEGALPHGVEFLQKRELAQSYIRDFVKSDLAENRETWEMIIEVLKNKYKE